jgi:hypothetical protein
VDLDIGRQSVMTTLVGWDTKMYVASCHIEYLWVDGPGVLCAHTKLLPSGNNSAHCPGTASKILEC